MTAEAIVAAAAVALSNIAFVSYKFGRMEEKLDGQARRIFALEQWKESQLRAATAAGAK